MHLREGREEVMEDDVLEMVGVDIELQEKEQELRSLVMVNGLALMIGLGGRNFEKNA